MTQKVELEKRTIRLITRELLECDVLRFQRNNPDKGSFIISDILGTSWDERYVPFYKIYDERGSVAGHEMGKVLSQVADRLGLRKVKENRFGKKDAITRYFFT